MMTIELTQEQRDSIFSALESAATKVLASYCGSRGRDYMEHDDEMTEQLLNVTDYIAHVVEWHKRREGAVSILEALGMCADDERIERVADLLEDYDNDIDGVRDGLRDGDLSL